MRFRSLAVAASISLFSLMLPTAHGQDASESTNPRVQIITSMGKFTLELYPDKAPKSVENFLTYVNDGFYKGTVFHRVINDFMIQGGGLNAEMVRKQTREPIENEASNGLKNEVGTVAMARTGDPHSATSQFFINVKENKFLDHKAPSGRDWGYAVFGKVVDGMKTVEKIKAVATGQKGPYRDVPMEPILIKGAKVLGEK